MNPTDTENKQDTGIEKKFVPVRKILKSKIVKEATPPASDAEAESSADEAPPVVEAPKKSPTVKILPHAEWMRLMAMEKEYNEMKAKLDVFVQKDIEKKAKANASSKKSKSKKTKETKEVKAKLEVRVEALEKLIHKTVVVEEEFEDVEEEVEEEEADE